MVRMVNWILAAKDSYLLWRLQAVFAFQGENNQRIWFVKGALTNGTHMGIKPNSKVAGSKLNYCESNLERREVLKFKLECVWSENANELWILKELCDVQVKQCLWPSFDQHEGKSSFFT